MSGLPHLSGSDLVKIAQKQGYEVVRQKGSHMRLVHTLDSSKTPLTIPNHRELGIGCFEK